MPVKDKVLSVVVPNPETGAEFEMNMLSYKRFLIAAKTPENEIMNRMIQAVEPYKQRIMSLGFSEEEANEHIIKLIEEESTENIVNSEEEVTE